MSLSEISEADKEKIDAKTQRLIKRIDRILEKNEPRTLLLANQVAPLLQNRADLVIDRQKEQIEQLDKKLEKLYLLSGVSILAYLLLVPLLLRNISMNFIELSIVLALVFVVLPVIAVVAFYILFYDPPQIDFRDTSMSAKKMSYPLSEELIEFYSRNHESANYILRQRAHMIKETAIIIEENGEIIEYKRNTVSRGFLSILAFIAVPPIIYLIVLLLI